MSTTPPPQQTKPPENRIISYHKIRLAVGIIGMLLPFCLWILNAIINESGILHNPLWITFSDGYDAGDNLKDSISHFYYSTVGELFTGALCAVSLFLFCYRGYDRPAYGKYHKIPGDNFMCNFAGAMALLVVIFPTSADPCMKDNFRAFVATDATGYIHYGAAVLFFVALSIISFVNFRRTKEPENFGKNKSHHIFKKCAIVMFSCMLILLVLFISDVTWSDDYNLTYWLETVMLVAFGISWTVKGQIDQQLFHVNYFGNGVVEEE
ncbi:hypothetical protein [Flavobacterium filum]|uniref:hypothetical protein n=1 Tax=Flavobacterium filum TaxID=370974 RepID=UPI000410EA23|nr:hypothetical protein [Flavobacterium filum]